MFRERELTVVEVAPFNVDEAKLELVLEVYAVSLVVTPADVL